MDVIIAIGSFGVFFTAVVVAFEFINVKKERKAEVLF